MSQEFKYPDFIRALPQANIAMAGVTGFLLAAPSAQMVFFEIPQGSQVPPHSHGAQWGIVVAGRFDFTIDGVTRTYSQGDSYFVPAGAVHSGVFTQDCRIIEVFADADRYKPRD
jgi:quercetin dioxygenase-like cupin family protein